MDIACPNCAAAYRVPDALVFSRKPVRCAACGTRWVPDLPAEAPALGAAGLGTRAAEPLEERPGEPVGADAADPPSLPLAAPPLGAAAPPPAAPVQPVEAPPAAHAEMLAEDGTLIPRPAAPPPLAETRWTQNAPRRVRGGALLPLAWGASLLAMGGLVAALVLFRHGIAALWPPFGWVVPLLGG